MEISGWKPFETGNHWHLWIASKKYLRFSLNKIFSMIVYSIDIMSCLSTSNALLQVFACGAVVRWIRTDLVPMANLLLDAARCYILGSIVQKQSGSNRLHYKRGTLSWVQALLVRLPGDNFLRLVGSIQILVFSFLSLRRQSLVLHSPRRDPHPNRLNDPETSQNSGGS